MAGAGRISRRRLAVLVVVLLTLLGVWWAVRERRGPTVSYPPPAPQVAPEVGRLQAIGEGLLSVQAGMPRADVEAMIGRADPQEIGPADRFEGHTVYRVRYRAILSKPLPNAPNVRGYCEVELVYDATRPGHPLIQITYTPKSPPPGITVVLAT